MEPEFWAERWEKGETGFHRKKVHPQLVRYFQNLQMSAGERIFVPLCGKSLDMLWLAEQGLEVVGVELSELGLNDFFSQAGLFPNRYSRGQYEVWQAGRFELLQGDFFALSRADLGRVRHVYDRAALVALPPQMRPDYAARIAALLPAGGRLLLISYDYLQQQMEGPPFAVPLAEVEQLFASTFRLELLADEDTLAWHPGLQARGVTELREFTCLLERR